MFCSFHFQKPQKSKNKKQKKRLIHVGLTFNWTSCCQRTCQMCLCCLSPSGLCLYDVCVCKSLFVMRTCDEMCMLHTHTHTQACASACVLQKTDDFPCRPQWKASFLPTSTQTFCSLSSAVVSHHVLRYSY